MAKNIHEIRDPIHVFIRLSSMERRVLDSKPVQRLRHIHQLGLNYLVYPGATHRRFEHSIGVMELAGEVFDTVTSDHNLSPAVIEIIPELKDKDQISYWRRVIRMAALCHDIGHLPFSHVGEKELLPPGRNHEDFTRELIESDEMRNIWENMRPPLKTLDLVKIALGRNKAKDLEFSEWEEILGDIIVGDAFGVDRMDYLLRDAHHVGVPYGKVDHYRLIDSIRILPTPPTSGIISGSDLSQETYKSNSEDLPINKGEDHYPGISLGVDYGGLKSAENLLLARYFMYTQVYFHPIVRIYGIHLQDFLREWLPTGSFTSDLQAHQSLTDNEVTSGLLKASKDCREKGYESAKRIIDRTHFKELYRPTPQDKEKDIDCGDSVFRKACEKYKKENVRYHKYTGKGDEANFPVSDKNGQPVWAISLSEVLQKLPVAKDEYVFIRQDLRNDGLNWLSKNKNDIIVSDREE